MAQQDLPKSCAPKFWSCVPKFFSCALLTAAAITASTAIAGCASVADADGGEAKASSESDLTQSLGGDVFESGVLTSRLESMSAPGTVGRQHQSEWCWAADLQTILRFHGLTVTQEQIVTRAFGGLFDRPQSPAAIAATVNGWVFGSPGGGDLALVQAVASDMDELTIRSELENDRPPILGLENDDGSGHAYIITAITYRLINTNSGSMMVPLSVKLRDPWPDNPNMISKSWSEIQARFAGLVFIGVQSGQ